MFINLQSGEQRQRPNFFVLLVQESCIPHHRDPFRCHFGIG